MAADRDSEKSRLSVGSVLGYGVLSGPFEMLRAPALAILPALYTKEYGLELTTVSLAILLLRLSDSATDFVVGALSDRTRSAMGPRKPWLLASIFLAVPAAYGLYVPGDTANIWAFSFWYFLFYLAWTMFDIPYTAWSAELSHTYEDRSRLALSRLVFGNSALILLSLVPLLPFLPSTEMTFATTEVIFWIVAIAFPLGVVYAVIRVPAGADPTDTDTSGLRETLRAVRHNKPMLLFLGIAGLADLAMGIGGAMAFLFFDTYLGLGASFSMIFISSIALSIVSLKVWEVVVKRTSKKRLLMVCLSGGVLQGVSIFFMEPGPYILPLFICFLGAYYVLGAGRDVALYAMVGDIVDYDSWRSGGHRAGLFSSAWLVLRKLTYAIGPGIGFFIAGILGYDPAVQTNDALGITGLKIANGYLPAALLGLALLLSAFFPITPERHRAIRQRLQRRAAAGTGTVRTA